MVIPDPDSVKSGIITRQARCLLKLRHFHRKLLKEHEAKYAALSEEESRGIMQEILAMQIGISADANVEDNEEAEQMIRAITHGEIENSVR